MLLLAVGTSRSAALPPPPQHTFPALQQIMQLIGEPETAQMHSCRCWQIGKGAKGYAMRMQTH